MPSPSESESSDLAWGAADAFPAPARVADPPRPAKAPAVESGDDRTAPSDAPLLADPSFWGMNATQFLGAMNDNVYKFALLFIFVSVPWGEEKIDLQGLAIFVFSVPFILFSGFAGYLSDKLPKRGVVVAAKVAEIVIMTAGAFLFWRFSASGYESFTLALMLITLFCMGTQSTFFGPGKYGILPELLRKGDLPSANSVIVTFTFLAIIFGAVIAGFFKQHFGAQLWIVGLVTIGIAVAGTLTSLVLRKPPASDPGLKFRWDTLGIPREMRELCRRDRELYKALAASTAFWFVASLAQPTIVALGQRQLYLEEGANSLLQAMISLGIVVGALLAGWLSRGRFEPRLMRIGLGGLLLCVLLLAAPKFSLFAADPERGAINHLLGYYGSLVALGFVGVCTGMFAVPLTTLLQSRPPLGFRGRTIATQNLLNWIGITFAAVFYQGVSFLIDGLDFPPSYQFVLCGVIVLGILLLYHPARMELREAEHAKA
jgi:acyl-[acyl-carrier-protein]-phospholipid O-acyltransferase/long-chain-fatty-acid--[acyl-carrier-protein] ligase